jgi:hypothetical protein
LETGALPIELRPWVAGIVSARSAGPEGATGEDYAARVQRRALGILFAGLAVVLAATAVAALIGAGGSAKGWVVAVAALALAGWLASLAATAWRRRRGGH